MCDVPKTLESTSAPASSETGTYRLHLGHRDPGSTLLIHAEPLQDTRAPRSARDARRALQVARLRRSHPNAVSPSSRCNFAFLSKAVPLAKNVPRFGRGCRRETVKRTNARDLLREVRRDPARHTRRARHARDRLSCSSPSPGRFRDRPAKGTSRHYRCDRSNRRSRPSAALPTPVCQRGIDPVSGSRSRRDRVADPARRAPRRAAHVTLIWRRSFPAGQGRASGPPHVFAPARFPRHVPHNLTNLVFSCVNRVSSCSAWRRERF